jgi:hypothetical protein
MAEFDPKDVLVQSAAPQKPVVSAPTQGQKLNDVTGDEIDPSNVIALDPSQVDSAAKVFGTSALRGVLPTGGGLVGAGLGAEAVSPLAGFFAEAPPVAAGIELLGAGVGAAGGGAAFDWLQNKVVPPSPQQIVGAINSPNAAKYGAMLPSVAAMANPTTTVNALSGDANAIRQSLQGGAVAGGLGFGTELATGTPFTEALSHLPGSIGEGLFLPGNPVSHTLDVAGRIPVKDIRSRFGKNATLADLTAAEQAAKAQPAQPAQAAAPSTLADLIAAEQAAQAQAAQPAPAPAPAVQQPVPAPKPATPAPVAVQPEATPAPQVKPAAEAKFVAPAAEPTIPRKSAEISPPESPQVQPKEPTVAPQTEAAKPEPAAADVAPVEAPTETPKEAAPAPSPQVQTPRVAQPRNVEGEGAALRSTDNLPVERVASSEIKADPKLMQYKATDEVDTGVNQRDKLSGQWDETKAGIVTVWQPNDPAAHGLAPGQKYIVANGHHRLEFAQRAGRKDLNVHVLKEADGWSALDARMQAAEINIADGKGSPQDAVKYLRAVREKSGDAAMESAAKRVSSTEGARRNVEIAKNLTGDALDLFINDRIDSRQAHAIALNAPGNEVVQNAGAKAAAKGMHPEAVVDVMNTIKDLLGERVKAKSDAESQGTMWDALGMDDAKLQEIAEKLAMKVAEKRSAIDDQLRAVQGAAKRPDKAVAGGVKVKNVEKTKKYIDDLKRQREELSTWRTNPELRDQIYAEAGVSKEEEAAANGGNPVAKPAEPVAKSFDEMTPDEQKQYLRDNDTATGDMFASRRDQVNEAEEQSLFGPKQVEFQLDSNGNVKSVKPAPEANAQPTEAQQARKRRVIQQAQKIAANQAEPAKGQEPALDRIHRVDLPGGKFGAVVEHAEAGSLRSGLDTVQTPADVAHVTGEWFAQRPQEVFAVVVADKNGKIINIARITTGTHTAAMVPQGIITGAALGTPGAAKVWAVHNHPSGRTQLSPADISTNSGTTNILKKSGIEYGGLFAIAKDKYSFVDTKGAVTEGAAIPQFARTKTIPITERVFTQNDTIGSQLKQPSDAIPFAKSVFGDKTGVLLLNNNLEPVGSIEMTPDKMTKLRQKGGLDTLLPAIERSNAVNMIAYVGDGMDVAQRKAIGENLSKLSSATGNLQTVDMVGDGKSYAHEIPSFVGNDFKSLRDEGDVKRTATAESPDQTTPSVEPNVERNPATDARKADELDRRINQNAENRANDNPARRGYQGIVDRAVFEARKNGELSDKEVEGLTRILNMVGNRFFDGVKLSVREGQEGQQGQYESANRIVTIFRDAIREGRFEDTAAHEVAHHLAQFLPESDRAALRAEWLDARRDFLKKNPGFAKLVGAEDADWNKVRVKGTDIQRVSQEYPELTKDLRFTQIPGKGEPMYRVRASEEAYRLFNANEWFAETFKDVVRKRLNSDPVYTESPRTWKDKLVQLWEGIKTNFRQMFGKDQAAKILSNFAKGRYSAEEYGSNNIHDTGHDVMESRRDPVAAGQESAHKDDASDLEAAADGKEPTVKVGGSAYRSVSDFPVVKFFKSVGTRIRTVADINPQSPTARKVADDFSLAPGRPDSENQRDYGTAVSNQATAFRNKLGLALGPVLKDVQKMTPEQRARYNDLFVKAVEGRLTNIGGETGKAVERVKKVLAEMRQYGIDAGLEMGEIKDYFPRSINEESVAADPKGFVEAASKAYKARYERMSPEDLQKEFGEQYAGAGSGGKRKLIADASVKKAEAWRDAVLLGREGLDFERNIFQEGSPGSKEDFQKARQFTTEEAAMFDDFREKDVGKLLAGYSGSLARRAEIAKRFGADGSGWAESKRKMYNEGVSADHINEMQTALQSYLGVTSARLNKAETALLNANNAFVTTAFLKGTGLLNLVEPGSMGIRTGNPIDAGTTILTNLNRVRNILMTRKDAYNPEALSKGIEAAYGKGHDLYSALALEMGINHLHRGLDSMSEGFHSDEGGSEGFWRKQADNVHRLYGISATETAKRESSLRVGSDYIDKIIGHLDNSTGLVKVLRDAGFDVRMDNLAKDRLAELGVKPDAQNGFADWVKDMRKQAPEEQLSRILDPNDPQAAAYRNAVQVFSKQAMVQANRSSKTIAANDSPLGKILFQLTTYPYEWSMQHTRNMAEIAKKVTGKNGYSATERLAATGSYGAMAVLTAAYYGLGELRKLINGASDKKENPDDILPEWVKDASDALMFTGVTGPGEMAWKAIHRGQMPAGVMGDWAGKTFKAVKELAANPDSNAAERNAVRAAYRSVAVPAANMALGAVGGPIAAGAAQIVANPQTEKEVADTIAGEPTPKKRH